MIEPPRVERKRAERVARVERTAARVFAERGYEGGPRRDRGAARHARSQPDFLPLFVRIRPPAADLRDQQLGLRREHEAVFARAAEQVELTSSR